MIDFTDCKVNRFKVYGGANGAKRGVLFENETYMLKFPSDAKFNEKLSYANNSISEYIGCHVFSMLGIPAQQTFLGVYHIADQQKIVCACKDMEINQYRLKDFASLKNTVVKSGHNGYGTDLLQILQTIEEQNFVSPVALKKFFWDMFVVDAFLGNFDRHNGNWGFLVSEEHRDIQIAPVFDCGSCLYPQIDLQMKREVMANVQELAHRMYVYPTSALQYRGEKINYFDFLSSNINTDCTASLLDIEARIDMKSIDDMINAIDVMTDEDKDFYKFMLGKRKEMVLEQAINRIPEHTRQPNPSLRTKMQQVQIHLEQTPTQRKAKRQDVER